MLRNKRSSITIAILSIAAAIFLMALRPSGDGTSAGFVGITETLMRADGGVLPLNAQCHAEYPGSRLCNSEEILQTVDPPVVNLQAGVGAWVRPVFVPTTERCMDASGLECLPGTQDLTCDGWKASTTNALIILPGGSFEKGACGTERAVTCCVP